MTSLVPAERGGDDLEHLGARVAELDARLAEQSAEVLRVKAALNTFKVTYRQQVGSLHEQLEQLELEIAEAELGELAKNAAYRAGDPKEPSAAPAADRPEPLPRFTSDAVRKLFRDVARTIHPDLSRDEATRDRRHTLMIEANRAYALGDEELLRSILQAWEKSPEAVEGSDPEAMRLRLVRRAAELEEQLAALDADLAAMLESPLGKLNTTVDDAARKGKDLVRETVRQLKRDIMAATNRLAAMRPPP
ncbi:MAG: hypothetical protein Q8O42_06330 [Acidobacteriota bacterium]|nr:hypothetical protein [Acidobacteriota bacterium]